jgi:hypothetical protein
MAAECHGLGPARARRRGRSAVAADGWGGPPAPRRAAALEFPTALRSRDCSRTTQHSLPAGGPALAGRKFHPRTAT